VQYLCADCASKLSPKGTVQAGDSLSGQSALFFHSLLTESALVQMDHLACFVGGMLVLGSEGSPRADEYLEVAKGVS
jgi:hypothetical protein